METQKSVALWCDRHYPGETMKDRLRMLMEEASELAVASGELPLDEALDTVRGVWRDLDSLPKAREHVISGLADVQISLYSIADASGLDVQDCLDRKMRKNRETKN